ncbi:MAG: sigma-70 family RNA polymerase sigma factor [Bacteroidales bacterium]|jgi:RNA polymerase sigma factor (sigma-70 family)|nr:sigma-70 family RNA polymerase sigma factor [Bacteroidales bacterium]MBQ5403468.1 sigma-70 family RNA polymerase sigma factor [Bacteroidales bacterium]MBR6279217.1 sigma-70 family RNA polymerase sigma factor [Bacteroidales bacterium]
MRITENAEEVFPLQMLEKITSITVKNFIKAGYIGPEDYQDFTQTLKMRYLSAKERIEGKFKSDSLPQTYMSSVIKNMMLEELRAGKKYKERSIEFQKAAIIKGDKDDSLSPENRTVIENEKKHLQKVFLTLGKDRAKVVMCCKMVWKIKVTDLEFRDYLQGRDSNGAEKYLDFDDKEQNQDIYQRLCMITNLVENKNNKPDAVRLWLSKKIEQVITRLNANRISKYDAETFGILLEETYY